MIDDIPAQGVVRLKLPISKMVCQGTKAFQRFLLVMPVAQVFQKEIGESAVATRQAGLQVRFVRATQNSASNAADAKTLYASA